MAARAGADIALAGGAGDDAGGNRSPSAGCGTGASTHRCVRLIPEAKTPVAIVAVNGAGEARYQIYGEQIATVVGALSDRLEAAVRDSAALFISSNTLVGLEEREVDDARPGSSPCNRAAT